jgi:hypothetical protein
MVSSAIPVATIAIRDVRIALPFGDLWYGDSGVITDAIDYAKFYSRSHDAVIRVYDSCDGSPTLVRQRQSALHPHAQRNPFRRHDVRQQSTVKPSGVGEK